MIQPKKAVQEMEPYYPPIEGRESILRFDFNENTIGCSPKVIRAISKIQIEKLSMYPEYEKFREILARYLKVEKNQVMLTNGTDEAIKCIIDTYVAKGDEIILPVPTFSIFRFYASIAEAKVKEILYNEDLSFPTEKILNAINKKTKLVILVNPNNPTGTKIEKTAIEKIVKTARNSIVLIDEAYYQYSGKSSKSLILKYDNVIITQTFSKAFGLAGVRLGYIISSTENIVNLSKVISPYSVNSIALVAGEAALSDERFSDEYVKEVLKSRKILIKEFKNLGIKAYPSYANFFVADFGFKYKRVYRQLRNQGILVRDRSDSPLLRNCLRIGIGTREQTEIFLKELKKILFPEALLFDMDGVLFDISLSYRLAIKKTAEFFSGKKVSFEQIQRYKEQGNLNNDWDLTNAILKDRKISLSFNKVVDKFQEFYLGSNFDGFIQNEKLLILEKLLSTLAKKFKLGIVTGRPKEEALYSLKKFDCEKYFSVVICMENIPKGKTKPDPYSITLALKKLNAKSGVYFGDALDDIKAAIAANIEGVGILPQNYLGNALSELMLQNKASIVIKDVNEIEKVIL